MSEDKLNEVGNDNLDKDSKLITDTPSESLKRTDGPKRRSKEPRKTVESVEDLNDTEKVLEEIVEEPVVIEEEVIEIPEALAEIGIDEIIKIEPSPVVDEPVLVTGTPQGNPTIAEDGKKKKKKKSNKVAKNVAFEEPKIDNSKKEEHIVSEQNEESKAPKTVKDRYIKMLDGKGFEVRLRGNKIFNSPVNNTDFSLDDAGITLNKKHYKYSEVVIRIIK